MEAVRATAVHFHFLISDKTNHLRLRYLSPRRTNYVESKRVDGILALLCMATLCKGQVTNEEKLHKELKQTIQASIPKSHFKCKLQLDLSTPNTQFSSLSEQCLSMDEIRSYCCTLKL